MIWNKLISWPLLTEALKINSVIRVLERLTEKRAPLKRASQSKRKQLNKPWLTKGILASI